MSWNPRAIKALGLLLTYPEAPLRESLDSIEACLTEALPDPDLQRLRPLLSELREQELLSLQERYVALFDRSSRCSLHLYEHVHGDSRQRGQAMVALHTRYAAQGLRVLGRELPDYLPLLCEFLSLVEEAEAQALLQDAGLLLSLLQRRLEEKQSAYGAVLAALQTLSGLEFDSRLLQEAEPEEAEQDSPEALDAAWEEQAVTFSEGAAHDSCGAGRTHERLIPLRVPDQRSTP